tara:strand:- start:93 stop:314 length:222 start_codon:yes stop_codon:yes gene_type:complete
MEGINITGFGQVGNSLPESTLSRFQEQAFSGLFFGTWTNPKQEEKGNDKEEKSSMEAGKFEQQSGGRLVSKWL